MFRCGWYSGLNSWGYFGFVVAWGWLGWVVWCKALCHLAVCGEFLFWVFCGCFEQLCLIVVHVLGLGFGVCLNFMCWFGLLRVFD